MKLPPIKSGSFVQLPPGTIQVDPGEIRLDNLHDVVIRGWPDTRLVCQQPADVIVVNGGSNIWLDTFGVQGPGPILPSTGPRNMIYTALIHLTGPYSGVKCSNLRLVDMPNHGIGDLRTRAGSDTLIENCHAVNGGNYMTDPALHWDGAAFACGVQNVRYEGCSATNCIRGFEMEDPINPSGFFSLDGCWTDGCSHVACWITPTGCQNGRPGQLFSGSVKNCRFVNGANVPNGFIATGIACTGGCRVQIIGNFISNFPDGCGILCHGALEPIDRFTIMGNHVSSVGRSGILVRTAAEGRCLPASNSVVAFNVLDGIVGTPIDLLGENLQDIQNTVLKLAA